MSMVVLINRLPRWKQRGVFRLGARDFLKSMGSVLRLSKKSDKEQFFLYLKLVLLGVGVVGTIGFMIKLLSTVLPTVFG
jgi:protein translocase SEC61 complex gamma subunit